MTLRIVSPAKPSVMNSSSAYPTSTSTRRSWTATTISRPLSLPLSPTPRPPFWNILPANSSDVAVRLERRHGRDDDDVAAGRLQRADAPIELAPRSPASMTLRVVVDRRVQCRAAPAAASVDARGRHGRAQTNQTARIEALASCSRPPRVDVLPDPFRGARCSATRSADGSAMLLLLPLPALRTSRTTDAGMPI